MLGCSKRISFLPLLVILLLLVGINHALSFAASAGIMVEESGDGEFCVLIEDAPKRICSFTLDLKYDTRALEFSSSSRGDLVQTTAFPLWDVNSDVAKKPGVVRVGAISLGSDCVSVGSSGTLVCVEFTELKPGKSKISLENLTGQLAGIKIKHISKKPKNKPKGK